MFCFLLSFEHPAHGFWHLSVPGCISVRVHPASFESVPGCLQALHSALLWLKVSVRSLL